MNSELKKFIKNKFSKPGKILDLGCGNFNDINGFKKLFWKTEGVDLKYGVDLENYFLSKNYPFDLVISNYLIHKIKNKDVLIKSIYDNLKNDGWFFIQTFHKNDKLSSSKLTATYLKKCFKSHGFKNIKTRIFDFFDDEIGHKHWHKIIEISGRK